MIKWIKQLLCKHEDWRFHRNIFGEEINYTTARSVYQCRQCGKYDYRPELNRSREAQLKDLILVTSPLPPEIALELVLDAGFTFDEIKNLDL